MGWCHEFGPDISEGCEHPMTAGESHCFCAVCGVTCDGRFAGCSDVWARGPKDVALIRPRTAQKASDSLEDVGRAPRSDPFAEIEQAMTATDQSAAALFGA